MKYRITAPLVLTVGLLPVSVLYFDGYWNVQLAAIIWGVYAIAGWLVLRRQDVWRTRGNRWYALLVAVILGGAQLGVHMDLPISDGLTVALWYLVFGVGLASAGVGVEMASAKGDDGSIERSSSTPASD